MPGPAPDPNALRRDRPSDAAGWTTLPVAYTGEIPEWPLPVVSLFDVYWVDKKRIREFDPDATESFRDAEIKFWESVWRKPQAAQWIRLGLGPQVAAYVRAFLSSVNADATSGMKTAVLRMEDGLGISVKGLNTLRWRIIVDEVKSQRSRPTAVPRESARARAKSLGA